MFGIYNNSNEKFLQSRRIFKQILNYFIEEFQVDKNFCRSLWIGAWRYPIHSSSILEKNLGWIIETNPISKCLTKTLRNLTFVDFSEIIRKLLMQSLKQFQYLTSKDKSWFNSKIITSKNFSIFFPGAIP